MKIKIKISLGDIFQSWVPDTISKECLSYLEQLWKLVYMGLLLSMLE